MIVALFAATVLMADAANALQSAPVAAPAQTTAAAEPNAKPAKASGNGLICRNEPVLGSRLPTKRCRTAEQMAAQKLQDQADLEKLQRTGDPGR